MITSNRPVNPFLSTDESIGETVSVWTLFSHIGVYVMAIGSLIPAGLGVFCSYFFWCQPVRLACQPLQSGSIWYTIVDDNVEAAPIYRCNSKAGTAYSKTLWESWPVHIKWEPTWMGSWQKQTDSSLEQFLHLDYWIPPKSREHNKDIWSVVRLRFGPVAHNPIQFDGLTLKDNSHFTHQQMHHLYTITLSTLKIHTHMACISRSKDMHHLLLIGSIKHHLDQGTCTTALDGITLNIIWTH